MFSYDLYIKNYLRLKFISFFDFFNPEYLIFEHNFLNELENFYKETIDAYAEKKELASTQIESINQPIKPELLYLEQSLLSKQLNLIKKIEFNKFISKKTEEFMLLQHQLSTMVLVVKTTLTFVMVTSL